MRVRVADGTLVGGWVSVGVRATKEVTVGGNGDVMAETVRAARRSRLTKATARQPRTAQKAAKSTTTRFTGPRDTRLRSNSMSLRVYHRGFRKQLIMALRERNCSAITDMADGCALPAPASQTVSVANKDAD